MRITPIKSTVAPSIAPTVRAPLTTTSGFAQGLGQLGAAIGETGIAAGQISRTLQIIEARKKAFDDKVLVTNLTTKQKGLFAELEDDLEVTDYYSIDKKIKDGISTINKTMGEEAATKGPEVAAAFKVISATKTADNLITFNRIRREKLRQNTIGGTIAEATLLADEVIKDPSKLAIARPYIFGEFDDLRANFGVPGSQVELMKEKWDRNVETGINAAVEEAAKQEEELRITNAYNMLTNYTRDPLTGKPDYAEAFNMLKDETSRKALGLTTVEEKKKLVDILRNEQATDKLVTDKLKAQQTDTIQKLISSGNASDAAIERIGVDLSGDQKFAWKQRWRARAKSINAGEKDPFKLYDPGKRAEVSRLLRTDLPELEKRGGEDYIYGLVGLGTKGGLTTEQAERYADDFRKRNEPEDPTNPLKQETYKQAAGSLDLFRRNWHFIEAEVGDDIDDEEAAKNEYTYGKLVEELEARVKEGEEPYAVLEDIMKPFAAKESGSILDWFIDWMKGYPTGQRLEETVIKKGAELGKRGRIERKEIKTPETKEISPAKDNRARAIEILMRNKKVVNEESIAAVMEQL